MLITPAKPDMHRQQLGPWKFLAHVGTIDKSIVTKVDVIDTGVGVVLPWRRLAYWQVAINLSIHYWSQDQNL